jgi:predicted transcriptional regulator
MGNRLLARRLDLLKFIRERELVYAYEIEENFGYNHRSISNTLTRLKKAGLIINMTKRCWELTEEGYRKLRYYNIC